MYWKLIVAIFIWMTTYTTASKRSLGQLPMNLKPIHYRFTIQPYFPADGVTYDPKLNFTFHSNLSILIDCVEDSENITLHMDRIEIRNHSVVLTDADGGWKVSSPVSNYAYDEKLQQIAFVFNRKLISGQKYLLNLSYTGQLKAEDLAGFYTSSYVEYGKTKWLAVTQFESTDARRALPCFDEPYYKAIFYVTIIHPTSMIALSNGLEERTQKLGNGWSVTEFSPTLNMSTYLLAMAVCDFQSKQNYTKDGKTLFRVWARPSFINKTDYAVSAGPKVLDYYTDYFGIPFPLPKQDMLAVPDFSAGAMENWGLITYRENSLLYDEKISSSLNRQRVAVVIAHEISHQWFGDLVTMEWWDDLWLNEGFATYMEFVGTDIISDGAFNMDTQFVSAGIRPALALDQLDTSHPIFVPVSSIDEIFEIFDDISYEKGGSVLRMLNYTLSDEVFKKALHIYLTKSSYANANHRHLWDAMTDAASTTKVRDWNCSALNVSEFMNPWVLQMGYPVLNVERTYGEKCKSADIAQKRFVLEQQKAASTGNPAFLNPPYNFTWYVPLWYQTEENSAVQSAWLQPNQNLTIYTGGDDKWLLLNYEAAAYCRVNYDARNWNLLQKQLMADINKINTKSRAQLIDDAMQLARAGQLAYEIALNMSSYLINETSMIPWQSADANFEFLNDMLLSLPEYKYFKAYMIKLTQNLYDHYGFDDSAESMDDVPSHYLRQLAVFRQCRMGAPNCVQTALLLFRLFFNACLHQSAGSSECSTLYPGLRSTIYCIGVKEDDQFSNHWTLLWNLHAKEQVALEKERLMLGLSCTKNVTLINKLLNEALNENSMVIRRQDAQFVFSNLASNEIGRKLLWPFLEQHWPVIKKSFAKLGLDRIISSATRSFNTGDQVNAMQNFYENHVNELGTAKRTYEQQLERARANKRWMDSYGQTVIAWLKNRS